MNNLFNFISRWVGGAARSIKDVSSCIQGSQVSIGIVDNNDDLIGFTRVISDFTYKAFIFDVVISSHHRGECLGQELMRQVRHHQQLKNVKHFELYCLPEMAGFYESFGFSSQVDGLKLMRCINS